MAHALRTLLLSTAVLAALAQPAPALQGMPGVPAPAPAAPSYGLQPYDPGNPTGFSHPNQMGYGQYHNPSKLEGPRSGATKYRRFKGY